MSISSTFSMCSFFYSLLLIIVYFRKKRLDTLKTMNIPIEFHCYQGLSHGFGLGTGTVAQGWVDDAIAFWQRQITNYD